MFELALTSATTATLILGLVATTVLIGCLKQGKKATEALPVENSMSNDPSRAFSGAFSPNSLGAPPPGMSPVVPAPPAPGMMGVLSPTPAGGPPGRAPIMSVNNREAPDLVKNQGGFNPASVNFSNISDFRGNAIKESSKIQNDRAKSAAIQGMMTNNSGVTQSSEDSSSEYDTESEFSSHDEDKAAPTAPKPMNMAPAVPSRSVAPTPPISPTPPPMGARHPPRNPDFEQDLEAGIQRNPALAAMRGGTGGENGAEILKSLNFTKEAVAQSFAQQNAERLASQQDQEFEGSRAKRRVKKKKRTKKKVRSVNLNQENGMGEIERVPGAGKKKRRKAHEDI